jgi:hypothetical protein
VTGDALKEFEKLKWSLQHRFLDPTLSDNFDSMPEPKQQLKGATNPRIFLPRGPANNWFWLTGFSFLVRRTKLLTPSVAHLPVFKVA